MNRRGFLKSILASGVAPYVVTTAGVLMPVRALAVPWEHTIVVPDEAVVVMPSGNEVALSFGGWTFVNKSAHIRRLRVVSGDGPNALTLWDGEVLPGERILHRV